MAKKTMASSEVKKLLKDNEVIIGTERTIKSVKLGKIEKVILSSNVSESVIKDLDNYKQISEFEIIQTDLPSDELGIICKKPFAISVLSVLKGANK